MRVQAAQAAAADSATTDRDYTGAIEDIELMSPINSVERQAWVERSMRYLDLTNSAFEVSFSGLPSALPVRREFGAFAVQFDSADHVSRIEREIADAFLVRLRGLYESRLKELGTCDWRSGEATVRAVERAIGAKLLLDPGDVERLGELPVLRNAIAHADGKVDATTRQKMPVLTEDDVWMDASCLRNWFALIRRLFRAIGAAVP